MRSSLGTGCSSRRRCSAACRRGAAQAPQINQNNTPYGTTAAEFLLLGAGARGTALGGAYRVDRVGRERPVLQSGRRGA